MSHPAKSGMAFSYISPDENNFFILCDIFPACLSSRPPTNLPSRGKHGGNQCGFCFTQKDFFK